MFTLYSNYALFTSEKMGLKFFLPRVIAIFSLYLILLGAESKAWADPSSHSSSTPNRSSSSSVNLFSSVQLDATENNTEVRRLRIGAKGNLLHASSFKAELDIDTDGNIEFRDAYFETRVDHDRFGYRIGYQRTPNSLNSLTSSKSLTISERAAFTTAFDLDRRIGVTSTLRGKAGSLSGGTYGGDANGSERTTGLAIAGRGSVHHELGDRRDGALHVALSYLFRDEPDPTHFLGIEAGVVTNEYWCVKWSWFIRQLGGAVKVYSGYII